jgi:predicted transcriptional regulator
VPDARDTAVTIRMSDEEKRMLNAVAEAKGLSISDVVRQAIRAEHAKLQRKAAR